MLSHYFGELTLKVHLLMLSEAVGFIFIIFVMTQPGIQPIISNLPSTKLIPQHSPVGTFHLTSACTLHNCPPD